MRSKRIWAVAAVLLCSGLVLAALTPAPGVSVEKKAAQVVPQSAISARAVDQVVGKPSEVVEQATPPPVSAAQPADDPVLQKQQAELEIMAEPIVAGDRAYCAAGASVFDEYIRNVTVGTINNTSSWSPGGYADYTYLSTDIMIGVPVTITVTIGTPYSGDRGGLWVDWNNDEDFTDPGEQLYSGAPWTGVGPYVGTITAPPGTVPGPKRMRVRLTYASNPQPCGTTTYGEVEDYTLNVLQPPPEGACCFNDVCQAPLSESACVGAGGVYMGDGSSCSPINPCVGACCYPDGSCVVLGPASCTGLYLGGGTNCGPPNPCPQPPDFVVTGPYPYTHQSNTCGAGNDCALRPSEERTYQVHIPAAGLWTFTLCNTSPSWDTYMYVGTTLCGSEIAFNDDFCGLLSQITVSLTPGIYYVTIEAYSSSGCGAYQLDIIPPCELECPPDGMVEGEPLCGPNYVDTYNGGCNSSPYVFQNINLPVTICGESGTYLFGSSNYRDTDWFQFVATGMNQYSFTVTAEFPVRIFVLTGTCSSLTQVATASGSACVPVTINTPCLSPGTYWFWVGPNVFSGVDCGSEYLATITATPCVVTGACCRGAVCTMETQADCVAGGGIYRGDNVPCNPNPCAVADEVITGPYPYAATGNTCGAQNNCLLRPSEDYIYEVHIPTSGMWTFSLCRTSPSWDSYLYIGTTPCSSDVAYNDDFCGLLSEITVGLTPGVYYVTVEAYSSSGCGAYILDIIPPCELQCPPTGYPEDEPLCGQDYVDTYNGGCNSSPYVFQPIGCHSTICGKSGTYLFGTSNYRDTDWYEYVATESVIFNWTVTAEFPVRIFVLNGTNGCGGLTQIATANGPACTPVTITTGILSPGTYWFWVGPNVFSGVPCDSDYVASLTCTQIIGACCSVTGCEELTEGDCNATGGLWMGPNTVCDVDDCNNNGTVDECELALFPERDCNHNGIPDDCDIASGFSQDCQGDGIPDECQLNTTFRGNLIQDPSFEGGTPNAFWTEYSQNFGTPLCDAASCGTGGGTAGPRTGAWWAWFGGYSGYETGYLQQSVTIPSAAQAFLRFYLWKGAGTQANDYVRVKIDNTVLFTAYGNSTAYPSYTLVELNVAAFADGGTHVVRFESETFGGTVTNFSIDDVELVTAGPPANDCNLNGIPDECDIQVAFGGFCQGTTYPPCDTDYNQNGVPDHCELCGDLNGDGNVDALDYWIMLDGFGRCAPDPRYVAASAMDVNGNNCIDLVDYRAWFLCYKMANGKAFVPPPRTRLGTSLMPQAAPRPALQ